MKPPIVWGSESFWVGEQHIEVLEEWSARQGMDTPCPFPQTLPYTSLLSACSSECFIISIYNKLGNVFLSSESKLVEPKEVVTGTSDLQPVGQNPGDNLDLCSASEVGGGQTCRTELLTCGISCYFQVDSVRFRADL